jgi:hypothetical protein
VVHYTVDKKEAGDEPRRYTSPPIRRLHIGIDIDEPGFTSGFIDDLITFYLCRRSGDRYTHWHLTVWLYWLLRADSPAALKAET